MIDVAVAERALGWGPLSESELDQAIDCLDDRTIQQRLRHTDAATRRTTMSFNVGDIDDPAGVAVSESDHDAVLGVLAQMGDDDPTERHWCLPVMGVDVAKQGGGLGSALLRHAAERCDRDGLPAYLEATNPRNARLYAAHGFEELGVIQAGGSPPIGRCCPNLLNFGVPDQRQPMGRTASNGSAHLKAARYAADPPPF